MVSLCGILWLLAARTPFRLSCNVTERTQGKDVLGREAAQVEAKGELRFPGKLRMRQLF